MGYCYEALWNGKRGRLVCDCCSEPGARKRTCPAKVYYPEGKGYGLPYCPAPALCSKCYATLKTELHKDCHEKARKRNEEIRLTGS